MVVVSMAALSEPPDGSARAERPGKAANNSGKPRAAGLAQPAPSAIVAAMSRRIAIVEDEPAIRANYADALRKHGYEVAAYAGRAEALAAMRSRLPDLALIDIGLGADVDGGFALCRELRALSATLPIIFLTARDSDFDIVAGLRLGADDYLTKDVSLPHLLARIAALFRRAELAARRRRRAPSASSAARWRSTSSASASPGAARRCRSR